MTPRFEQLDHTADLALRIHGRDLRELFASAAYAMFSQLAEVAGLDHTIERIVRVRGTDCESLLVNWLNELLYLHETEGEVYSAFRIDELSSDCLAATVHGAPCEEIYTIIKAATYHNLTINKTGEGFVATVVFDV
ncbi:MAG: archease [Anaerolineales bacterium]|nr:MAG: archease [Anaerolineales bacterium]